MKTTKKTVPIKWVKPATQWECRQRSSPKQKLQIRLGLSLLLVGALTWLLSISVWHTSAQIVPPPPKPTPKPKPVIRPKPISAPNPKPKTPSLPKPSRIPAPSPKSPVSPKAFTEDLNGVKLEMITLPGGIFLMGSNDLNWDDEKPIHHVRLSPFSIGKYEVTQAQWEAVMGRGNNPSLSKGDDLPVENVSWEDAVKFCEVLSAKTGKTYRLPTEAEWEYAARGGNSGHYSFGNDKALLGRFAWYRDNKPYGQTPSIGLKRPNGFGLYDMHGNVWEWCSDWKSEDYYSECYLQGVVTDPLGPNSGKYRVRRGGSWEDDDFMCRSACRYGTLPNVRSATFGVRVVMSGNNTFPSATRHQSPTPEPTSKPTKAQLLKQQSQNFIEDLGNDIKLEMIALSGGTFLMGSNDNDNEKPIHRIRLSPFFIGKHEVTQAQWKAVMDNNPSRFKGDTLPVESVSWKEAVKFCEALSARTGKTYRLPTEAEWEYAARGGNLGKYNFGNDAVLLGAYAWYDRNSSDQTHPVGEKRPNVFGLYDMHGNVEEWCLDRYSESYYRECFKQGVVTDPQGPDIYVNRTFRGGSWFGSDTTCRSTFRWRDEPGARNDDLGFRVVVSARTPPIVPAKAFTEHLNGVKLEMILMPQLYELVKSGKADSLLADGTRLLIYSGSKVADKPAAQIQQPLLFDFSRKRRDTMLIKK